MVHLQYALLQRSTVWSNEWCHFPQEIRSVKLGVCPMQLFHFWSRDVHPVQNLLLFTKFHENRMSFHWNMAIIDFQNGGRSPSWNYFTTIRDHPRSLCCWPQLPVKFHVNLIHHDSTSTQYCRRSALYKLLCMYVCTQIWRYSHLNFPHIWLEIPIQAPERGVLGDFELLNVIIHHRDPQQAYPCVNPRPLSYQL